MYIQIHIHILSIICTNTLYNISYTLCIDLLHYLNYTKFERKRNTCVQRLDVQKVIHACSDAASL